MSRIGKLPVSLPAGVTVSVNKSNVVTVKGPKGELQETIHPEMIVEIGKNQVEVKRPTDQKRHKAMHGLYRKLIDNMVVGVSQGFKKEMQVIGVGYKAEANGNRLELSLGFSHPILMLLPEEIKVETETKRGTPPEIRLSGIDKQLLGHIAAKIRSLRPPEPYKGKGIKFKGEEIRRKAGKAAGK